MKRDRAFIFDSEGPLGRRSFSGTIEHAVRIYAERVLAWDKLMAAAPRRKSESEDLRLGK